MTHASPFPIIGISIPISPIYLSPCSLKICHHVPSMVYVTMFPQWYICHHVPSMVHMSPCSLNCTYVTMFPQKYMHHHVPKWYMCHHVPSVVHVKCVIMFPRWYMCPHVPSTVPLTFLINPRRTALSLKLLPTKAGSGSECSGGGAPYPSISQVNKAFFIFRFTNPLLHFLNFKKNITKKSEFFFSEVKFLNF